MAVVMWQMTSKTIKLFIFIIINYMMKFISSTNDKDIMHPPSRNDAGSTVAFMSFPIRSRITYLRAFISCGSIQGSMR
jgi:hypothetical protein